MPHLTFQIGPTGSLLDVIVTVSKPRADALTKAGQPTPAPVQARLLIDTGASGTAIDPSILTKLGLSPTGIMTIHTPSTGPQGHQVNQYDVGLAIQYQGLARQFLALPVGECSLNAQGIDGLLGRDVLAHCLFIYTGPDNAFILSF